MSEENKDLSEKADDAINKAKEGAENIGEKASEKFDDAKEAAGEFAEDAKEKVGEFADDVKKEANEFKDNVKDAFSPDNPDRGKTVAIIAHITLIGWIVALLMNNGDKTEMGSFYIRQVLGIMLLGLILGLIPILNFVAWIVPLALWVISLVGAFGDKQKEVPLVGEYFQTWFKAL